MVEQAITLLDLQADETVLDLFCGLGNFTLAMARSVRLVVGVEGEQSLVDWAQRNAARNGIDNARFFAADLAAEATAQPWLRRGYDKVLLDPPRSGALAIVASVAALAARRVVYVSCHPATLARDAGELVHRFGYKLLSAGVMDMFLIPPMWNPLSCLNGNKPCLRNWAAPASCGSSWSRRWIGPNAAGRWWRIP